MSASRRRFAQSLLLSAGSTAFHAGRAADAPTNVLLITADQMRGDCMGTVGHPNVRTPNLDRMAREGVLFRNGFVPPHWHSAVYWPEEDCSPHINTESALKFLGQAGNDPFFLHVSYFDPRPPYMAPARYASRYGSLDMVLPERTDPAALSARLERYARAS